MSSRRLEERQAREWRRGRKLRVRERHKYTEEHDDDSDSLDVEETMAFDLDEKITAERFEPSEQQVQLVKEMTGPEVTLKLFQQTGFTHPMVVKKPHGLGMKMPNSDFSVEDVKQGVGSRRVIDVMDTVNQKDETMTMKEWVKYFENEEERDRILNVISLEFSHTKLENYVEPPSVVKLLDWVDLVWPKHLKDSQTEGTNKIEDMKYPKVQKYCLMSVKGCYTDFHIDFGGTSVWYHIIKGQKIFWLIPPSDKNIKRYEEWVLSGKQADVFFGDTADECQRITLEAGNTFFIPSGWIHAVYTPQDSIVFGGNFLHTLAVERQLQVAQLEYTTKVPAKFRYPFYTEMLWYVLQRHVHCLEGRNHLKFNEDGSPKKESAGLVDPLKVGDGIVPKIYMTPHEVKGLRAIVTFLEKAPKHKKYVPDLIEDPALLLEDVKKLIKKHENDDPTLACTGVPLLFWGKRKTLPLSPNANISHANGAHSGPNPAANIPNAPPTGSHNGPANLSITAQLRQIKNHHFPYKAQVDQNRNERRPPSPPTRPLSSNQYTVSSKPFQGPIPSSFAGLIAATAADKSLTNQPLSFAPPISIHPPLFNPNPIIVKQEMHPVVHINGDHNAHRNFLNGAYHGSAPQSFTPSEDQRKNSSSDVVSKTSSVSCETQTTDELAMSSAPSAPNNSGSKHQDMCTNTEPEFKVKSPFPPMGMINKQMSTSTPTTGSATAAISNDSARRRRTRCKKCEACLRSDCSECHFCKDMKKFGGPGRMKQSCIARQCMAPVLPHTACCIICGRDGWEKLTPVTPGDETQSTLMECTLCWEILHPICLLEKDSSLKKYESKINTDLPNSWECPKCIAQNQAINSANGPLNGLNNSNCKNKIVKVKKETGTDPEPFVPLASMDATKKFSPQLNSTKYSSNDSSEDELVIKSDDDSSCSSSLMVNSQPKGMTPTPTLSNSSQSSNSVTHVRSCSLSRFPLLSQGIQQLGKAQPKPSSPSISTPTPPLVSGISSSLKKETTPSEPSSKPHKPKKSVDIKARLFNKMKSLKKLGTDGSRLQNRSAQFHVIKQAAAKFNQHKNKSGGGSISGGSCGDANSSGLPSPIVMKTERDEYVDDREDELKPKTESISQESTDEDDDETEEEPEETYEFVAQINKRTDPECSSVEESMPPLKKPKIVVRPAPLPEDLSSDTEVEEDDDEENSDDESKDEEEEEEDEERLRRQRIMNHHLKRFKKKRESNLALERDVIINVLPYLSRNDIVRCSLVCRNWNRYCMDPRFWRKMDISNKRVSTWLLRGLVIRQPLDLDLSWTRINYPQLSWLIARLPLTERLSVCGLDADVVKALITCNCPFLKYLNLDWVSGISDNFMRVLLSAPPDSRPGLIENESRLRNLEEIKLSGTDITDATVRLLATNLPHLNSIDLSSCRRVTDMGITYLATKKAHRLTHLNLSCCPNITPMSLESLKHCTNIQLIDLTKCDQITTDACRRFAASTKALCMPTPNIIKSRQIYTYPDSNQQVNINHHWAQPALV